MGDGFTARFFRWASPMGELSCERFGSSLLGLRSMGIVGSVSGGIINGSGCIVSSRTVSRDHSSHSWSAIAAVWLDGSIGRLTKNRRSTDLDRSVGARVMIFRSLMSEEGSFSVLPTRLWSLIEPHGWLVSGGDSTSLRIGVLFCAMFLRSSTRWFMDEGVFGEEIFSITGIAHW